MAPDLFIVFIDNVSGFKECPTLRGDTLNETISNIKEAQNQYWYYYIYQLMHTKVPLFNGKVLANIYRFQKVVSGAQADPLAMTHKQGLGYAITDWSDTGFVFADTIFVDPNMNI